MPHFPSIYALYILILPPLFPHIFLMTILSLQSHSEEQPTDEGNAAGSGVCDGSVGGLLRRCGRGAAGAGAGCGGPSGSQGGGQGDVGGWLCGHGGGGVVGGGGVNDG